MDHDVTNIGGTVVRAKSMDQEKARYVLKNRFSEQAIIRQRIEESIASKTTLLTPDLAAKNRLKIVGARLKRG